MAKNKAGWIAAVLGGGIVIYLLTRKTTATTATTAALPRPTTTSSGSSSLISQRITALTSLFGGGSSGSPGMTLAPVPAGLVSLQPTAPVSATSPASGINYINPSAAPELTITPPSDTAGSGMVASATAGTDIYDLFA